MQLRLGEETQAEVLKTSTQHLNLKNSNFIYKGLIHVPFEVTVTYLWLLNGVIDYFLHLQKLQFMCQNKFSCYRWQVIITHISGIKMSPPVGPRQTLSSEISPHCLHWRHIVCQWATACPCSSATPAQDASAAQRSHTSNQHRQVELHNMWLTEFKSHQLSEVVNSLS